MLERRVRNGEMVGRHEDGQMDSSGQHRQIEDIAAVPLRGLSANCCSLSFNISFPTLVFPITWQFSVHRLLTRKVYKVQER